MRLYTVNLELWGPLKACKCGGEYSAALLTDEENGRLPGQGGPEVTLFIFENKLGTDICGSCLRKNYVCNDDGKLEVKKV